MNVVFGVFLRESARTAAKRRTNVSSSRLCPFYMDIIFIIQYHRFRGTVNVTVTVNSFRDSISVLLIRGNHLCNRRGLAKSGMAAILH